MKLNLFSTLLMRLFLFRMISPLKFHSANFSSENCRIFIGNIRGSYAFNSVNVWKEKLFLQTFKILDLCSHLW